MSDVLPFVTWLSNTRHRTSAHAFVPGRSLSMCRLARRLDSWAQHADAERCKKCEQEIERMRRGAL